MRTAICAVYDERWEDRLWYRKQNGIAQFFYEHVYFGLNAILQQQVTEV
jgi:hypothetical protein